MSARRWAILRSLSPINPQWEPPPYPLPPFSMDVGYNGCAPFASPLPVRQVLSVFCWLFGRSILAWLAHGTTSEEVRRRRAIAMSRKLSDGAHGGEQGGHSGHAAPRGGAASGAEDGCGSGGRGSRASFQGRRLRGGSLALAAVRAEQETRGKRWRERFSLNHQTMHWPTDIGLLHDRDGVALSDAADAQRRIAPPRVSGAPLADGAVRPTASGRC